MTPVQYLILNADWPRHPEHGAGGGHGAGGRHLLPHLRAAGETLKPSKYFQLV